MEVKPKNKMEKFNKIKEVIAAAEADAEKFYNKGRGAAGTRLRKAMLDIKILAQDVRVDVSAIKNNEIPPYTQG